MKIINLAKGLTSIVDDEYFELLSKHKWYVANGYAAAKVGRGVNRKTILMHRLIMEAQKGQIIDHKDRNPLNNQKSNLRFCTQSQNLKNKSSWGASHYLGVSIKNNTSKYLTKNNEVCIYTSKTKYVSEIRIDNKRKYLGCFKDEIDAAIAYNNAALLYHGEFANLNIIST